MFARLIPTSLFLFLSLLIGNASIPNGVYYLTEDGSIGTWLTLGPIPDPAASVPLAGYNTEYLDEENLSPVRGETDVIQDATYTWTPLFEESGDIRLSGLFSTTQHVSAYFYCVLESDRDVDLILHVGQDDAVKVWLGGLLIHERENVDGDYKNRVAVPVSLSQGRQSLFVKVCQNEGFWGLSVRLKDAGGKTPAGIRVILPGEWEESEYLNTYISTSIPPLVTHDGNRLIRLKLPAYANPVAVESLTVYDGEKSDKPVWTSAALTQRIVPIPVPRSGQPYDTVIRVTLGGRIFERQITIPPCRNWRVFLHPGSHVDIGYTDLQEKVMADHKKFFRQAWDLYEESLRRGFMHDAHYIWNPEVTWVIKDFLRTEPEADRRRLLDYLRRGVFTLDALYCNLLTALCGDEELIRSVYYSMKLADREHLPPVRSAMITDVPGYTWGIVPVLAGAGVRYFELGPNFDARIGRATLALKYHPYYWIGPDGQSKVLVWNTGHGYSNTFNMLRSENGVEQFLQTLAQYESDPDYPYDVARFRAYLVDNTPPPDHLSQMVQEWNRQYQVPHLILSGASAPFEELESRFGDRIPSFKGDYTPYWEDGAASSARETAMNRSATLRMQEADAAWALARVAGSDQPVPLRDLEEGYDKTMLYSEHTWGAHNSISEPDSFFAQDQWRVKREFAEDALWLSSQLKRDGLRALSNQIQNATPFMVAVWNLTQWPRSDEAVLSHAEAGSELKFAEQWIAIDSTGERTPVLCGERGFVFQAKEIPPYGYKVYQLIPHAVIPDTPVANVNANDAVLSGGDWELKADPRTGGVSSLVHLPSNRQWIDSESPYRVNQYLHVLGPDGNNSQSATHVSFQAKTEESQQILTANIHGQGVEWLRQEIRLFPQQNRIDFTNTLNKSDIRDKEALRFAFPFQVPGGKFTLEIPLASMQPETDQIPGANRNIYTLRRWIDISNAERGVTLVAHDAPLVELCEMHAEKDWLENLPLINTHFYSYAMNNYWFTNYKACQGGPTVFRYSLWIHEEPGKPSRATRFADEVSSPLCVIPLRIQDSNSNATLPPTVFSLARMDAENVLIQNIKWAENGDGLIVRLRELDGVSTQAQFHSGLWKKFTWQRCDIVERPLDEKSETQEEGFLPITIGSHEIQTFRLKPLN